MKFEQGGFGTFMGKWRVQSVRFEWSPWCDTRWKALWWWLWNARFITELKHETDDEFYL